MVLLISPDWSGKPGAQKLVFCVLKKRPTEALFRALKTQFLGEDLERKAGLASKTTINIYKQRHSRSFRHQPMQK